MGVNISYNGPGALHGKMLMVGIIENNKIFLIFGKVRLSKGQLRRVRKWIRRGNTSPSPHPPLLYFR